jgi:Cof subfamily protein (haloacid dehalogenase superfamily)
MEFDLRQVRLVATDLDGTLLRSDGTISTRTIHALTNLSALGFHVVFVTARPPRFVKRLVKRFPLESVHALCCNGALTYDLALDSITRHICLGTDDVHRLIRDLRDRVPGTCFASEIGLTYGWEPEYAELEGALIEPGGIQSEIVSLCQSPVTKLIARHPAMSAAELLPIAREVAGDGAYVTHSGTSFVEISAPGVEKAASLEKLSSDLGIRAHEVMAFGDMPNDMTVLEWAGISVAVSNAHPDVLTLADYSTFSNDDDGVAHVLERLPANTGNRANAAPAS